MVFKNRQNKVGFLQSITFLGKTTLTFIVFFYLFGVVTVQAQVRVTATPVRAVIASSTPQPTPETFATATPTWTPTQEGPVRLTVKPDGGEINVRSEPDPNSQRLGSIKVGEEYVVRGRYFSWFIFDFPTSPTGTGWVFNGLVDIIGDESRILEVNPYLEPTSQADADATQTLAAVLQTPGGDATATADARILVLPSATIDVASSSNNISSMLPTYTPPAEYVQRVTPTSFVVIEENLSSVLSNVSNQGIPPIIPIIGIGAVGVLSILIGLARQR